MRVGIVSADRPELGETVAREFPVAWVARSEPEALARCLEKPADLIVLDLGDPSPMGRQLARKLSAEQTSDVLLLTSEGLGSSDALSLGALDALRLPPSQPIDEQLLLSRLRRIARVLRPLHPESARAGEHLLICVGASAGGPEALGRLLAELPPRYPAAIVVVQHVAPPFLTGLAEMIASRCALPVYLARPGVIPQPGEVLLAGRAGRNLRLNANGALAESAWETGARPSIDHFMISVAENWKGPVLGVLLTGLGEDGALGLRALRDRGHATVVQDCSSSTVFGMPRAAIELGAAERVLSLQEIARVLEWADAGFQN